MAVQSLTEALDNLYTTTWYHQKRESVDNIFTAIPFWFWMKDKNRFKTKVGGRFILEKIEYAKNDDVGFIGKGDTTPMNDREFLTEAQWNWHYLVAPLVRFGVDDQQNRGKMQIMDLMKAKLNNAQTSLEDQLETTLAAGAGAVGGAFNGLQHLIADDPTASVTVGGINQSTYTWWQNKTKDMTGLSFATNGIPQMRIMLNSVTNNRRKDRTDIILSGQTPFEYYESAAFDKLDLASTKMAELGFDSAAFKGIPLVWSPAIANTRMYFANTSFLYFVYDPGVFFDMTEWKPIPEQVNDRIAQIVTACSFVTNRRRVQGVMHTIDTA